MELDAAAGKHNGSIKGTSYFMCEHGHGVMVRPSKVKKESPANLQAFASKSSAGSEHAKVAPKGKAKSKGKLDVRNIAVTVWASAKAGRSEMPAVTVLLKEAIRGLS